ncbi:nickel pincer cofactor biosynthesis protein LarB, partial [Archaeoglobales archaeon]
IPVAEEAATTAEFLGIEVFKFYDVGVAGLHRLIEPIKKIKNEEVDVVIAIAGMEGALPSVVAGLIDLPIIAVPTSVGYGVNLKGISTLFAMLQSCSSGVAVVNIDNGFGAAVFASLIIRRINIKSPRD